MRKFQWSKFRWAIEWPSPPDCDENESPIREIDHTHDNPGPEELRGAELRAGKRGRI
jgi:hypothetical protein